MNKGKILASSSIANTFEWYDYALFGHFSTLIATKFFPSDNFNTSILYTFLTFALGYLMRPLGGIFFGVMGDKYGRKFALSLAVFFMAFPTAIMGLLPTYDDIGPTATILMIIVRMIQGLSMGGALTGSISFIIEHTDKERRGLVGSIPMACICMGLLLGSIISYLIKICMSAEQFNDWGWRVPFLLGILIFFIGRYIRNYTTETPLFNELKAEGALIVHPLKNVMVKHWFDMLMSIFINSTGSVIFYLQAMYIITFLKNNRLFDVEAVDYLVNINYLIIAIAAIFAGWLSDKIGRRNIFVIINILIIILVNFGLLSYLDHGNFTVICIVQTILGIIAGMYIGPEPALQAEFYETRIRNTALSISYNIATSVFGGTALYFIELLVQKFGNIDAVKYYITFCSILSLIGLYFYKDRTIVKNVQN